MRCGAVVARKRCEGGGRKHTVQGGGGVRQGHDRETGDHVREVVVRQAGFLISFRWSEYRRTQKLRS